MRWTKEQYDDYILNQKRTTTPSSISNEPADEEKEAVLQGKIQKWAKDWGRPILSFRQSKNAKGFIPPGWPDISLLMPCGRVLFIELKSKGGRLSEEQRQAKLQFMALGHEIHEVRSYRAFLRLAREALEKNS